LAALPATSFWESASAIIWVMKSGELLTGAHDKRWREM
jgi:hypothetical protein